MAVIYIEIIILKKMAKNWFSVGNRIFEYAGRSLELRAITINAQDYPVEFDDGSDGIYSSNETSYHIYFRNKSWAEILFLEPNNVQQIFISSTILVDFDVNLMPNITSINFTNSANARGEIANTSQIATRFTVNCENTLHGNMSDFSRLLTYIYIAGQNTISGDIGDTPSGVTYIRFTGQNTISGDIGDTPSGVTYIYITGQNTISGDIGDTPSGVTYIYIAGQNTISGDIGDTPSGVTYIRFTGQNTMIFTTKTWANNQEGHYLRGTNFTSAMVDAYLISLSNVATWAGSKSVDLRTSPAAPRTSASDAAVGILQNKGVTVLTY